jgi:hypothetical protein
MLPSLHGLLSKKVRYIRPSDHGISSRLQELRFKTGVLERKVRTEARTDRATRRKPATAPWFEEK